MHPGVQVTGASRQMAKEVHTHFLRGRVRDWGGGESLTQGARLGCKGALPKPHLQVKRCRSEVGGYMKERGHRSMWPGQGGFPELWPLGS